MKSSTMKSITLLALAGLAASSIQAQCRPPANSHEARLLAFYEAPLVFSMPGAPTPMVAGELRVAAEAGSVPSPSAVLQRPEFCYQPHSENTKLTPAFGRRASRWACPLASRSRRATYRR